MDIEELKIDNQVNNNKLGEYQIHYHYKKKTFTLKVFY